MTNLLETIMLSVILKNYVAQGSIQVLYKWMDASMK